MNLTDSSLLKSQAYFSGIWQTAASGATISVTNPATGQLICSVPALSLEEVTEAIHFAKEAMRGWQLISAQERFRILRRWFELVIAHTEDLAMILTSEQGKPLQEARGEIAYGASYIEWFAEEAKRIYGDTIPSTGSDQRIVILKQPIGVCAAITPWNFPIAMITRKVAPALAAGCAILVKPASKTPLSALALAVLAEKAGIPPGLLSVVTGSSSEIGNAFMRHSCVRKMTFTGSTQVGKLLMKGCADTVKKMTMELGGNAPFLVFADADLDAAIEGIIASKFRNSGQTCVCANRIFVQEEVRTPLLQKLKIAVEALRVGDGMQSQITQGPLIDAAALSKVEYLVVDALTKGARVVCGGARHPLGGTFYEPTILDGCTPAMLVAEEEIFGPVAAIYSFRSETEAIAQANATDFGLAAYFYSRDIGRIWRVAEALEVGMIGINTGFLSNAMAPFGGVKASGIGREGSKYGIEEYLTIKYLCIAGLNS